ncbi:hypothetical protein [Kitasatospora sp. NPDC097643]|uniref:hypothetical protein n=1 Tax=Kitasatospora sp. NPDC097643 TaxID=3157230 RepID=UPI00331C2711
MTSFQPSATVPSLPGPPTDGAGSPPLASPSSLASASAAARCSIARAAADVGQGAGAAGRSRHGLVPQPRGSEDATRAGAPSERRPTAAGDPTTARLRAALGDRLRAAHAQGRSIEELAAACRRPVEEVRALLAEGARHGSARSEGSAWSQGSARSDGADGVDSADGSGDPDALDQSVAEAGEERFVPVLRAAREEPRTTLTRRPSPSRRLRRMHPLSPDAGQEAAARETAATDPLSTAAGAWVGMTPGTMTPGTTTTDAAATGAAATGGSGEALTAGNRDAREPAPATETPLGILIGGTPNQPEAVGRPEERAPVRVVAEPVRIGRGTSLVVLPSWRPAIAVSVPTDQLLSATGLTVEQLADARLTVLMNPAALHDRELDLHGWRTGPDGRGRRGQRP